MQFAIIGLGAIFAVAAMMIASAQLMELTPLIADASGAKEGNPLRGIFRVPAYVIMLATILPLILAVIGVVGLRRF